MQESTNDDDDDDDPNPIVWLDSTENGKNEEKGEKKKGFRSIFIAGKRRKGEE